MSETNGNSTEEILQIDGYASLLNSILGVGNSLYDSSTDNTIDTVFKPLTDQEISIFTQKSKIAQRIIDIYPNDSSFGFPVIGNTYGNYSVTSEQLVNYLNEKMIDSRSLSLEQAFRKASRLARKWGVYYIILGVNDGRLPSEPIDENNIQSFEFLTLKNKYQLYPDNYQNPSYYHFNYDFKSSGMFNYLGENNKQAGVLSIHPDRVLVFRATELPEDFEYIFEPVSILQPCMDALLQRDKAGKFSNQLLVKKAVLWAKLQIQAAATPQLKMENLQRRLNDINRHSSIYRMIGMNCDEELGAVQIGLEGVDKILEANDSELLVQTGIVRYKLFGQPAITGLSQASSGLEQKIDHAQRCTEWSRNAWQQHLERVYNLACLSKDSPSKGRSVKGLSVNLTTYPELSPNDWALLRKQNSEWALPFLQDGVISKNEVRQSFFASNDLSSQLVPNLQLHDEFTKKLMEEVTTPEIISEKPKDVQQQDENIPAQLKLKYRDLTIALQYLPFQKRHNRILPVAYGYFENMKGSDGMALDVYVIPGSFDKPKESDLFFAVKQLKEDGTFDEEKIIMGDLTAGGAKETYLSIMPESFYGGVDTYTYDELLSKFYNKTKQQADENIEPQKLDESLLNKLLDKLGTVNNEVIDQTLEGLL
jgi:Protein of unknown function (DUF1073)/Inorganic Pyrophosphatase